MFRNATNFGEKKRKTKPLIKALSVVTMEFSLKCLSKITKTINRSLPICNRLRQIHFTNIKKNLGGDNRSKLDLAC